MDPSMRAATVAEALSRLLLSIPEAERPRLVAVLERRAAERYLSWADTAGLPHEAAGLRACAQRERSIADRVDRQITGGAHEASRYEPLVAEAAKVYLAAFEGATRAEAYAVQAALERAGAATWRAFAASAEPAKRAVLLECAALEEESAAYLDQLRTSTAG